jgi:hypothetical protein
MPVGVVALILMISLPSMVIAWLKLRQRNLGPILDANGWAVNARAKINIPFGKALTGIAVLPPGSKHDRADPYAESNKGRHLVITLLVLIAMVYGAWRLGAVDYAAPEAADWIRNHILGAKAAPAPAEAPTAK